MGEVRSKIKLTNSGDMHTLRRNLIKKEELRFVEPVGLVDTGAISLIIPQSIADKLGLMAISREVVEYADGRQEEVDMTEAIHIELMGRHAVAEAYVLGDEVLIGQIILELTDLHVDCTGQKLIPNPAHPDRPVAMVKVIS